MTDLGSIARRLLIIDDDSACRTTIRWLLQKLGHTVATAESGSAGLAFLRQTPVDLVMTDLNMPGITGWAVARLVKAMRPQLPVVLVTGDAYAIPLDQPERAWVDAILAKPCGAAAMQAVIGALTRDRADAGRVGGPQGGRCRVAYRYPREKTPAALEPLFFPHEGAILPRDDAGDPVHPRGGATTAVPPLEGCLLPVGPRFSLAKTRHEGGTHHADANDMAGGPHPGRGAGTVPC